MCLDTITQQFQFNKLIHGTGWKVVYANPHELVTSNTDKTYEFDKVYTNKDNPLWFISIGKSGDEQYLAGFHLFTNFNDAVHWAKGHPAATRPARWGTIKNAPDFKLAIVPVEYSNQSALGTQAKLTVVVAQSIKFINQPYYASPLKFKLYSFCYKLMDYFKKDN